MSSIVTGIRSAVLSATESVTEVFSGRAPAGRGTHAVPDVPRAVEPAARPPKTPRPPKPPRSARPPQPPRRIPPPPRVIVLTPQERFLRGALVVFAAIVLGLALNIILIGQLQHLVAQQQLGDAFREQLADGVAPVSEGDVDDVLLADGAPVALLEIPQIGLREVVVEGTDSGTLQAGPGHRRDTMLPGQTGVSMIMGRAAAFGGPFSHLQELGPGDTFTVITGQGEHEYEVIGLRYAGDPAPPRLTAGEGRLILVTARGAPYAPSGLAYVDARLTSEAQPYGTRQTTYLTLPESDKPLSGDTSMAWALVFALQFLVVVELAAVWSYRNVGAQRTWIVFVPLTVLAGLWVGGEIIRMLPNLL